MDQLFERQKSLELHLPKAIAVVGCGGVGSWTAYFAALAGVKKIWLFDGDHISESNLNRIPVSYKLIGASKSHAVSLLIKSIRSECEVYPCTNFSPTMADLLKAEFEDLEWVIATTDTHDSRKMVARWAERNKIKYIEAAAEGEFGTVTGSPADFATPEEVQPGYASVPIWSSPCVLSAIIAVNHVVHNTPIGDRTLRMGWDGKRFDIFDTENKNDEDLVFIQDTPGAISGSYV